MENRYRMRVCQWIRLCVESGHFFHSRIVNNVDNVYKCDQHTAVSSN